MCERYEKNIHSPKKISGGFKALRKKIDKRLLHIASVRGSVRLSFELKLIDSENYH